MALSSVTDTWHGIKRFHSRAHLLRAALEGVAFSIRDGLEALQETGVDPQQLLLAGGSARFPFWQQLLADVVQRELRLSVVNDASARGAALLAAQVVGEPVPASSRAPTLMSVEPGSWSHYKDAYESFKVTYSGLYGP